MKTTVLDINFDNATLQQAVECAMELIESRAGAYAVTPNPEIVYNAHKNERLQAVINGASLVLPDGIGIILASKILKRPITERVTGMDFAYSLMAEMEKRGKTLFLLGGKPAVAEKAAERLMLSYPNLNICGTHDGYFKEDATVLQLINERKPDVIFVCLGSPRQELWMGSQIGGCSGAFMTGLGGAIDIYAGTVKRAPKLFQKLGLEWLHRLIKQPSRIVRMTALPKFMFAVRKQAKKEKHGV